MEPRVITVYKSPSTDTSWQESEILVDARRALGERCVTAHWLEHDIAWVFENMTEAEIRTWLDAEFDRMYANQPNRSQP